MTRRPDRRRDSGLSLLEIMIGLAILGLLLSISVNQYSVMTARAQERADADVIRSDLTALRREAIRSRVPLVIGVEGVRVGKETWTPADPGWRVASDAAVRFLPSGFCDSGRIRLTAPSGRQTVFEVAGGADCSLRRDAV